jgi:CHRD domain
MRTSIALPVAAVCGAAAVFGAGALAAEGGSDARSAAQVPGEQRGLFAVLTGRKEVDADGNRGAGDPNGRGTFSATVDGDQLCGGITVKNLDVTAAAHIHRGGSRRNGPIVVPLEHPEDGDPGASAACATVDEALLESILRRPGRYYVNVHTEAFGAGAVRGQLFRRAR